MGLVRSFLTEVPHNPPRVALVPLGGSVRRLGGYGVYPWGVKRVSSCARVVRCERVRMRVHTCARIRAYTRARVYA